MKEFNSPKNIEACLSPKGKSAVLYITSHCPYSRAFKPKFEKYAEKNKGKYEFAIVYLDDYECPLWNEHNVKVVPTVVVYENGKECRRMDGRAGEGLNEDDLSVL